MRSSAPAGLPLGSWGLPTLILAVTSLAFLPVLGSGFVDWDDPRMFLDNPHFRGLGPANLRWAWETFRLGEYMPVTWMSYEADYVAWGLRPLGYHLSSLLLHLGVTLAVYAVTLRLLQWSVASPALAESAGPGRGARVGAAVAALVFSVHPLRVEPVAWVSARGTVLGALFALLSVLAYIEGCRRAGHGPIPRGWLAGSIGLFGVALLARATGVTLPLALLVLDVYPLRRLRGRPRRWLDADRRHVWVEKLAFGLPILAIAPLAVVARLRSGDPFRSDHYDALAGMAVALHGAAFYLGRTLVPTGLGPLYEIPVRPDPWAGRFVLGGLVTIAISALLVALRRRWPAGLAAWAAYLVLLLPMSGLAPLGLLHLVADRYSYLSCIGWVLLLGAGVDAGWRAWQGGRARGEVVALVAVLGLALLGGWSWLTWRQTEVWRDSASLWNHAVWADPGSAVAQHNLGLVLEGQGRTGEAIARYRRATEIWPPYAPFRVSLGRALARQGALDEAIGELRLAVRLRPESAVAHGTLGLALFAHGDVDRAIEAYERALGLDTASAVVHFDLGLALARAGRLDEARAHYRRALELAPDFHAARQGLVDAGPPEGTMRAPGATP